MDSFEGAKLATNYRNFPFAKLILWIIVITVAVALSIRESSWLLWAGLAVSFLMLYFGVGLLLFRNCSPGRRVGIKAYETWNHSIALQRGFRDIVPAWQREELWRDALSTTLSIMYPGVASQLIERQAAELIQQAKGKQLAHRIKEFCIRKGFSETDAIRRATSISRSLQQEDRLGDAIITYTLSLIIEKEFGVNQADRIWLAIGRGRIIQ